MQDLARLRIEVFRDYPYLYDGDPAYEAGYVADFANSEGAVIVGAYDGARIVGAATGAPLISQTPAWAAPLEARGIDVRDVFYCGESVLSAAYRGRGAGHAFFERREAQARKLGLSISCFCAVIRPEDHPSRPAGYRPLDGFWTKRGYAPLEGAEAEFHWKEVGAEIETPHRLQVWMRRL